ncbi:MAG: ABC transporter permease [Verrucomicrobia bacterium]|nr:ABC transporter permease [Verrucomicrobiota bacterium]MBV9644215.1 ABC transporter permease [Verrucomicrobiota bacterium]
MSSEAVAPPQPEKAVPRRMFRLPREIGILGALGVMLFVLAVFIPQFRDLQNITNITRNFSFVGIVAMGMTLVILTGGIDLSVGSVWGMTAVIVAFLLTHGWPIPLAILVSLLAAAGIGLINGLCITFLKMSPFVPTLATLSIARSFALIVTHGRPISIFGDEYQAFLWLGGGDILGIPNPFIIFCITAFFFWVLLSRTVWGRYVYAVGGNERTARLTGLRVDRLKIIVYILSAMVAGIAGIVQYSYLSSVTADLGTGEELAVIAATVIGGANLAGGEGTVLGTLIGAIILEVLRNGLLLFGIDPYWQGVFVGAVIILAVSIDYFRKLIRSE